MQIYASPLIFIIIQRRNYKEKQFFCKFLAGVKLAIFKSAVQCLIHWATAGSANLLLQKFIFNCQARSQGPRIFSRWQPLFRANSKANMYALVSHLCMQIYASPPIFIIIQRRNYKEKQFFSKFLAGVELAISESAVQSLIHWATAGRINSILQKLIFHCQARSQGPRIFSRWQPLFRASSKCLRPVSII